MHVYPSKYYIYHLIFNPTYLVQIPHTAHTHSLSHSYKHIHIKNYKALIDIGASCIRCNLKVSKFFGLHLVKEQCQLALCVYIKALVLILLVTCKMHHV